MTITGKVHCFFEQSGTFKNEFIKLGIPAEDYDIQNNFGETDHVIDLFAEIEKGYNREPSIFDNITPDDLIMAFYPCIYFETIQMCYYQLTHLNNATKPLKDKIEDAIARLDKRTKFHSLLYKLVYVNELGGVGSSLRIQQQDHHTLSVSRTSQTRPLLTPTDYSVAMYTASRPHIGSLVVSQHISKPYNATRSKRPYLRQRIADKLAFAVKSAV